MSDGIYSEGWGQENAVFGPLLGGNLAFAMFLYGISCAQVLYYFWHYEQDQMWLKSVPLFGNKIMLVDDQDVFLPALGRWTPLLRCSASWSDPQSVVSTNTKLLLDLPMFDPCVQFLRRSDSSKSALFEFGQYLVLGMQIVISWSSMEDSAGWVIAYQVEFLLSAIIAIIVQGYYILIVWKTCARRWYHRLLTSVLAILALGSLAAGTVNVVYAIRDKTVPGYGDPNPNSLNITYAIPPVAQMAISVITDASITISLCSNIRRKPSMLKARPVINTLSHWIISRGALTTTVQLLQMVIYILNQLGLDNAFTNYSHLWIAFQFVQSKIYVNSFLALLNARSHLRGRDGSQSFQRIPVMTGTRPAVNASLMPISRGCINASDYQQDDYRYDLHLSHSQARSEDLRNEYYLEPVLLVE